MSLEELGKCGVDGGREGKHWRVQKRSTKWSRSIEKHANIAMEERRDTGKQSLGICGSRQREALRAGLFVLRSR